MLDAAHELTVEHGWAAVRMGAIAARIGVSRQTLHAEFGTKETLGQALIMRVTERFLTGVNETLHGHDGRLQDAMCAAVQYALEQAERDTLLQALLTSTRTGADESMLPLLTVRGQPLLARASEVLCAWVLQQRPDLDHALVEEVVDSIVRLVVSHTVLLLDPPEVVADRLARLAGRGLGIATG